MMLQVLLVLCLVSYSLLNHLHLGVTALANTIPDMRAMTSLSLASNSLGVEGVKIIAAVLPTCT